MVRLNASKTLERRQRQREEMSALPPGLTYQQVAQRFGITLSAAFTRCKKFGYKALNQHQAKHQARLKKVHQLPPGLTIRQAAKRLKLPYQPTQSLLRTAGYKILRDNKKVSPLQWQRVDWTQTDTIICHKLRVSRQHVYDYRKRHGIPRPAKKPPYSQLLIKRFNELPPGLSKNEIAVRLKIPHSAVQKGCSLSGYKSRTPLDDKQALRRRQFKSFEPGLSLSQLSKALGICAMSARRWALKLGYKLHPANFRGEDGRPLHVVMKEKFQSLPLGLTLPEVARELKRDPSNARRWCREFHYQVLRTSRPGPKPSHTV